MPTNCCVRTTKPEPCSDCKKRFMANRKLEVAEAAFLLLDVKLLIQDRPFANAVYTISAANPHIDYYVTKYQKFQIEK